MAKFVIGTAVDGPDSTIEVTVDPAAPLSPGQHRFQLVVVDNSGNQSVPATVDIFVLDNQNPTAVLQAPSQVQLGQSFALDGHLSSDVPPGKIDKFIWTQLT